MGRISCIVEACRALPGVGLQVLDRAAETYNHVSALGNVEPSRNDRSSKSTVRYFACSCRVYVRRYVLALSNTGEGHA